MLTSYGLSKLTYEAEGSFLGSLNARRSLREIGPEGMQVELTNIRFPSQATSSRGTEVSVSTKPDIAESLD